MKRDRSVTAIAVTASVLVCILACVCAYAFTSTRQRTCTAGFDAGWAACRLACMEARACVDIVQQGVEMEFGVLGIEYRLLPRDDGGFFLVTPNMLRVYVPTAKHMNLLGEKLIEVSRNMVEEKR
jgi:hypothetical protein